MATTTRILVGTGSGSPWVISPLSGPPISYATITDALLTFRAKNVDGLSAQAPELLSNATLFPMTPIPSTTEYQTPSFGWEVTWTPRAGDYPADTFPHVIVYADLTTMGVETLAYVSYVREKHAISGAEQKRLTISHRGIVVSLNSALGHTVPAFVPDIPIAFQLTYDAVTFTTNASITQGATVVTGQTVNSTSTHDGAAISALVGFTPMKTEAESTVVGEVTHYIVSWTTPSTIRNLQIEVCGEGPCPPFLVEEQSPADITLATARGTGWNNG